MGQEKKGSVKLNKNTAKDGKFCAQLLDIYLCSGRDRPPPRGGGRVLCGSAGDGSVSGSGLLTSSSLILQSVVVLQQRHQLFSLLSD